MSAARSKRKTRRRRIFAVVGAFALAALLFIFLYFEPHKAFIDDTVNETLPGLAEVMSSPTSTTITNTASGPTASPAATAAPTSPATNAAVTTAPAVTPTAASTIVPSSTVAPSTVPALPPNSLSGALAGAQASGMPVIVSSGTFFSGEHETKGTALVVALPDGSLVVRFEDLDTSNGPDLRVIVSPDIASDSWKYSDRVHLGELKGNIGDQNYDVKPDIDLTQFKSVVIWCERFSVAFGAAPIDVQA